MPAIDHRESGLTTAILLDERVTVGFITDGVHATPEVLALAGRLVGGRRRRHRTRLPPGCWTSPIGPASSLRAPPSTGFSSRWSSGSSRPSPRAGSSTPPTHRRVALPRSTRTRDEARSMGMRDEMLEQSAVSAWLLETGLPLIEAIARTIQSREIESVVIAAGDVRARRCRCPVHLRGAERPPGRAGGAIAPLDLRGATTTAPCGRGRDLAVGPLPDVGGVVEPAAGAPGRVRAGAGPRHPRSSRSLPSGSRHQGRP